MNLSTTFASLRKQVAGISIVALVAGLFATGVATAATTNSFADVPTDAWFAAPVSNLVSAGVIDSTQTNFRPGDLVNRAEMAKWAFFVSGLPLETATSAPFNDVPMGQWYTNYIYTLSKNGVVSGDKDSNGAPKGTFRPGDNLNRAEASKMLVNAAQMAENLSGAPHFPDVASGAWYYNFVETLYNNGVIQGYPDGTFRPGNSINRAEAAKMTDLSMNPATQGFRLQSAAASSKTSVELIFSKDVEEASAEVAANYSIKDSTGNVLAVSAAEKTGSDTVKLTTASQVENKTYTVTAKDVKNTDGEDLSNLDGVSFLGYGSDVSGGALTVSLSTTTPVAGSVPANATGVVFTCWDFKAGADAVTLKSLNVHRVGPGSETAFANVYLYRGDSRITTGRSVNSSTQLVQFSNINQKIAAGENAKICAVADLSGASAGGVHALELATAGDVLSNSSSMTGSFPLRGADQLLSNASVGKTTVSVNGVLDEVTLGSKDARVAQFQMAADSTENQQLRRIALYVRGSAPASALSNLKLYTLNNTSPLATASSVGAGDLVTFTLATPYTIGKGETKVFYVTADVNGGRTGENFKVYLDETTDVFVTGVTYGYGTNVNIDAYDGDANEFSFVNLKGSKFTIGFDGPEAGQISVNQQKAVCMDMTITNSAGLDVEIKDWVVTFASTGSTNLVTVANGKEFTSLELVKLNEDGSVAGNMLGTSEFSLVDALNNPLSLPINTQDVTLKGTYSIASGESVRAAVVFNVSSTAAVGNIQCTLKAPLGNDQVKDSNNDPLGAANITPSSNIAGNIMQIVPSAITFTRNASLANNTAYAAGTNNAILLAVQAKAGSAMDTTIKSLTVFGNNQTTIGPAANYDVKDLVDSIGIYNQSGTLISDLRSFSAGDGNGGANNAGTITFNNLNVAVAKNATVNLYVKGKVNNSIANAADDVRVIVGNNAGGAFPLVIDNNGLTVTGVDVTNIDTFAEGAQLTLGAVTNVTGNGVGASDPKIFAQDDSNSVYVFKLKATDGAAKLKELTVNMPSTPVDSIALYSGSTSTKACGSEGVKAADFSNVTAGKTHFSTLDVNLPDSQEVFFCVKLHSRNVTGGTPVSNTAITLGDIEFTKVTNQSGSMITLANLVPGVTPSKFFKGVPKFNVVTSDSSLSTSTQVFRFEADSEASVNTLNKLAFTFTTGSIIPAACDLYRGPDIDHLGVKLNTITQFPVGSVVTFKNEANNLGLAGTEWRNGDIYTLLCDYTGKLTPGATESSQASLASLTAFDTPAIKWDDGNGANQADDTDANGFGLVDEILFRNVILGTKASHS